MVTVSGNPNPTNPTYPTNPIYPPTLLNNSFFAMAALCDGGPSRATQRAVH